MDEKKAENHNKEWNSSKNFFSSQKNVPEESLEEEISNVVIDDHKPLNSNIINIPSDEDLNKIFKISQNPSGNVYNTVNELKIAINVQGCVVEGRIAGFRILNGVDLKCVAGRIFCLFGANKSGKTTLLRAILRLSRISQGTIQYFDQTKLPNDVKINYMPQSVGLYTKVTVLETLNYFGKLMGIKSNVLNQKVNDARTLISTINLNVPVQSLDNSQLKQLSYAIAMLNDPQILILDEPTCGTDPMFKHSFWTKLKACSKNNNTTILLTTSDPEECLEADRTGYLRNGRIVIQMAAKQLLEQFSVNSVNKAFFCIAVAEECPSIQPTTSPKRTSGGFIADNTISLRDFGRLSDHVVEKYTTFRKRWKQKLCLAGLGSSEVNAATALNIVLKKRLELIFRQSMTTLQHLLWPVLCVILFYFSIGQNLNQVKVGIYFPESKMCNVTTTLECSFFKHFQDPMYIISMYDTIKDLEKDSVEGKVDLKIVITEDSLFRSDMGDNESPIKIDIDNTSKVLGDLVHDSLKTVTNEYKQNKVGQIPLECVKHVQVEEKGMHKQKNKNNAEAGFFSWGGVTIINHFCGVLLGGLPLVPLNTHDIIDRFSVIGITKFTVLIVHWISQILIGLVQNLLLTLTLIFCTSTNLDSRTLLMSMVLMTSQTICGISFGIFAYTLGKSSTRIVMSAILINAVAFIVCGIIWPVEAIPSLIGWISNGFPHRHLAESLRSSILRKLSFTKHRVFVGLLVSNAWTVAFFFFVLFVTDF